MLPIILVAPHSHSTIHEGLRDRFALSDYDIWKCSDPYTDHLDEFTNATYKHRADVSRLVCDLNRAPNTHDAFREFDFYGRTAFHPGQEFSTNEKENLLMQYWYPFHQGIVDDIQALEKAGNEVILLVDYHNTSGDHALTKNDDYMSSLILSNLGSEEARVDRSGLSVPYSYLNEMADHLAENLGLSVEINRIYRGGYNLYWYTHLRDMLSIKAKIFALQIEYNLDYVFNPITRKFDESALEIMQQAINEGLGKVYHKLLKEASKEKVHAYWRS